MNSFHQVKYGYRYRFLLSSSLYLRCEIYFCLAKHIRGTKILKAHFNMVGKFLAVTAKHKKKQIGTRNGTAPGTVRMGLEILKTTSFKEIQRERK